ncbi:hypothetical protein BG015_011938 [Linnemannia schmuckeri]|uniref:F-box domain-containing protein n=1 Tax=Linnemannia schmuckeri TaxID=64567 RepID=A0A9P5V7I9_9FUNG|nr:hypothetical protein BG015_011938 [Linnemannia schmuckeri]
MDPLSQLPLECLHNILECLARDSNVFRLTALLQTNRYLTNVTLPYLYKDPYQFAHYEKPNPRPNFGNRAKDPVITQIPTRTLLNPLPSSTILPKVLSLGLRSTESPVSPVATNSSRATTVSTPVPSGSPPPLDYLFLDLCEAGHLGPNHNWTWLIRNRQQFHQNCFKILFFREASWALAEPILEELQSLSIPTSTEERYLEPLSMRPLRKLERRLESSAVCRLKKLKRSYSIFPGGSEGSDHKSKPSVDAVAVDVFMPRNDPTRDQSHVAGNGEAHLLNTQARVLRYLAHPMVADLSRVMELDFTLFKFRGSDRNVILYENQHLIQRC